MEHSFKSSAVALFLLTALLFNLKLSAQTSSPADANLSGKDVPRVISYQGKLLTNDGSSMNGKHHITVTLFSDHFGKTVVWTDSYNPEINDGIFSILLGSGVNKLPDNETMDRPLWLGIKVEGSDQMQPLTCLATAPYAINVANNSITFDKLSPDLQTSMLNSVTGNPKTQSGIGSGGSTINTTNTCSSNEDGRNGENEVAGGCDNKIWSDIISGVTYKPINYSVISGGQGNLITSRLNPGNPYAEGTNWHTIGGGHQNIVAIDIDGGTWEQDSLGASTISGGAHNILCSPFGFIGGGDSNFISFTGRPTALDADGGSVMLGDVITGGFLNSIDTASSYSIIGGGYGNHISGAGSMQLGGGDHTVTSFANKSFIGGGDSNTIRSSNGAVIGGGRYNTVLSDKSSIVGGDTNVISSSSIHSFIGGGLHNVISSSNSVIAGGNSNIITGKESAIPGGAFLKLDGASFGFNSSFTGQTSATITDLSAESKAAVFNNADLLLGNDDNLERKLVFFAPNTSHSYGPHGSSPAKFTSFRASSGQTSSTIDYILPIADGSSGQFLKTNGSGVLSWGTAGGGGTLYVWYAEDAFHTPAIGAGPLANGYAAIAHGENVTTHSAYGAIGGGEHNLIDSFARHSAIAGGGYNTIPRKLNHLANETQIKDSIEYSFIGGGHGNTLRAPYGVIAGGESNLIDSNLFWGASYSAIGGGMGNTIDVESPYNVIGGGGYNYHGGYISFIGGGSRDTVFDNCGWDAIGGGYANLSAIRLTHISIISLSNIQLSVEAIQIL